MLELDKDILILVPKPRIPPPLLYTLISPDDVQFVNVVSLALPTMPPAPFFDAVTFPL